MASTFRLKRKLYSDDKGGMSTGKKLALGGLAAGAAILGAKKGAFGANIMAKTNTGLMKAGKAVGGKVGDRMMMSGAKDFGVARAKQIDNALLKKTGSQMTKQAFNAKADQKGMQALGKILDYFLHSPKQRQIGLQQKELLKQEKMPKVLRI